MSDQDRTITAADVQELLARWWFNYDTGAMDALPELLTADTALRVRTDTTPQDLAQRLSTAADPTVPTLVVDRSGRYQGVVTLARLLAHLGDRGGPT